MKKILFLSLSLCILAACGEGDRHKTEKQSDKLDCQIYTYEKYSKPEGAAPDEPYGGVKIEYPVLKNGPAELQTKFNDYLKKYWFKGISSMSMPESPTIEYKTIEEASEGFLKEYEANKKDGMIGSYQYEGTTKIVYETPKMVCLSHDTYMDAGGAHPNYFLMYENFSLPDFTPIGFEKVFSDTLKLKTIVEKEFKKQKGLPENYVFNDQSSWFWGNPFYVSKNFSLKKDSVTFFYNNYEIASYAEGQTEMRLPVSLLKEAMNVDFLK